MAKNKSCSSMARMIVGILLAVPNIFSFVHHLSMIVKKEASLAGRSLAWILILAVLSACLLVATWFCILALLFVYLASLQWGLVSSLCILLLCNILLLIIVILIMVRLKKNLSFPVTRAQLSPKS